MRPISALVIAFFTSPAFAQISTVETDLDGDGFIETIAIEITEDESVTLMITRPDGSVLWVPRFAWGSPRPGQQARISLNDDGSVLVRSMNEAIGINRWHQTVTIAYLDGAYMVVGFTYEYYNTANFHIHGTCDVNLITGAVTIGDTLSSAPAIERARPVTEWDEDTYLADCS